MQVILLPKALSRLDEIYNWLKLNVGENSAVKTYNAILDELGILEQHPKVAAVEPILEDLPKEFRSLIINKKFKAVYYIDEQRGMVFVATIWDCRQDTQRLRKEVF